MRTFGQMVVQTLLFGRAQFTDSSESRYCSSSNASCWGHKLKLDLILSLPLGRNPDLFLTSSGAPTQKQFQRIDPSVIAIPDSGQFFSLHLRQSTICETRALLLPGTEQTFDNANVRSATQEAPQELQHTRPPLV
jgi:hypothetical protein